MDYANLGNLYSDVGAVSEALASYQQALELDPKTVLYRILAQLSDSSAKDAHLVQIYHFTMIRHCRLNREATYVLDYLRLTKI